MSTRSPPGKSKPASVGTRIRNIFKPSKPKSGNGTSTPIGEDSAGPSSTRPAESTGGAKPFPPSLPPAIPHSNGNESNLNLAAITSPGSVAPSTSSRNVEDAKNVLKFSVETLGDLASIIPVPGISEAFKVISKLVDKSDQVIENNKGFQDLVLRVERLNNILRSNQTTQAGFETPLKHLERELTLLKGKADEELEAGLLNRIFRSQYLADLLKEYVARIDQCLLELQFAILLSIPPLLQQQQTSRANSQEDVLLARLKSNAVDDAAWNSSAREGAEGCLEGTRVDVLGAILAWFNAPDSPLLWLCGTAGTGKSTLAHTICELFQKRKLLGASFFFSRDQSKRATTDYLFQTLAFQMSNNSAIPIRGHIAAALEDDAVLKSNIGTQFRQLILEPLSQISGTLPSSVLIVLDALDECDAGTEQQQSQVARIVTLLAKELRDSSVKLKVFITSRPDTHIRETFFIPDVERQARKFILHELNIDEELTTYISRKLQEIAASKSLTRQRWPTKDQIQALVQKSGGLYITAATLVRLIDTRNPGGPVAMLNFILQGGQKAFGMDEIYTQVLSHSSRDSKTGNPKSSKEIAQLGEVLAFVVLSFDRLSPADLGAFLGFQPVPALQSVPAVVHVGPSDGTVRIIHASFYEFITDPKRCVDHRFFIDEKACHRRLAELCLKKLPTTAPKRNILAVMDRSVMNKDVQEQVASISYDLRYAARFWGVHLAHCVPDDQLLTLLDSFVKNGLLYWIEILSYIGELRGGLEMLENLIPFIAQQCPDIGDSAVLLKEARKFLMRNYEVIQTAAMHIYYSALPFTPKGTEIYKCYVAGDDRHALRVAGGIEDSQHWDPSLQSIPVGFPIASLDIFENESLIVVSSGFSEEGVAQVRDLKTGKLLRIVEGPSAHSSSYAVAISTEGSFAVSGLSDGSVEVWDVKTGKVLHVLEGHSSPVNSIALSRDGSLAVSASEDKTVRVWDLKTTKVLQVLAGHSGPVSSVALSLDGSFAVSGSHDATLKVWDLKTGHMLHVLEGHDDRVRSVDISQDGSFTVSASEDSTIRVWDLKTGEMLQVLDGHSDDILSVSISKDGAFAVSGSDDGTIAVWDLSAGMMLRVFEAGSFPARSVVVSRDGRFAVSASDDGVARVWDLEAITVMNGHWKGQSEEVISLAIQKDGRFAVSGSTDMMIRVWDLKTGKTLQALEGHSGAVGALALSHDGSRVVSGSDDATLRVWDLKTNQTIHVLEGHSDWVRSVDISQDGSLAVSGSDDGTVRLWDLKSGGVLQIMKEHLSLVRFVTISRDMSHLHSRDVVGSAISWNVQTGSRHKEPLGGHELACCRDFNPSYGLFDHWILELPSQRRVCWIPRNYTVLSSAFSDCNSTGVLGTSDGAVIILHFPQNWQ